MLKNNIKQLIGYFNLDPNRVLDIILEAFETNLYQFGLETDASILASEVAENIKSVFFELLKEFCQQNLALTLGFKITYILQNSKTAPTSLILLIAFLIREDKITVEQIWPYFTKQVRENGVFKNCKDEIEIYHTN